MSKYSKNSTDKSQLNTKNRAIISTAFQDHIIKQLQLNSLLNPSVPSNNSLPNTSTYKKPSKIQVKSKINTGLKRNQNLNKNSIVDNEKEYVLTQPNTADVQTLAEKIGLIPVDNSRIQLDENEWSKVKEKYRQREDYKEPCVICKEQLGAQQQVLLSCSHTFHRKCLEVFEKFSGKKSCPMCRKERYQTRVIHDASKHYKHLCASRIQAAWRGYLVRKWYKNYRRLVPPQNPLLRKKFFEEKLSDITNRICSSFNYETDKLINDIDKNIQQSRDTFKYFEEKFRMISQEAWNEILKKAISRDIDECSICMNRLEINKTHLHEKLSNANCSKNVSEPSTGSSKPVVLLSCTHIFHNICLKTFEELNFDKLPVCPECRSAYKKNEEILI